MGLEMEQVAAKARRTVAGEGEAPFTADERSFLMDEIEYARDTPLAVPTLWTDEGLARAYLIEVLGEQP